MSVSNLEDGSYTAVVDSIEDGLATVFFEEGSADVGNSVFDASHIPEAGRHADAIFWVTVEDEFVVEWNYQEDETEQRKDAAQNRFDRLSKRPPSDEGESDQ